MSADNAIYIRQLKDGKYAVKDESFSALSCNLTEEEIDSCFTGKYRGSAQLFNTYDEALDAAGKLEDDTYIVEYGIINLPRKEPVAGIRGDYIVKVARTVIVTYTFHDVTPEKAADEALAVEEALEQTGADYQVSVVNVTSPFRR